MEDYFPELKKPQVSSHFLIYVQVPLAARSVNASYFPCRSFLPSAFCM